MPEKPKPPSLTGTLAEAAKNSTPVLKVAAGLSKRMDRRAYLPSDLVVVLQNKIGLCNVALERNKNLFGRLANRLFDPDFDKIDLDGVIVLQLKNMLDLETDDDIEVGGKYKLHHCKVRAMLSTLQERLDGVDPLDDQAQSQLMQDSVRRD